MTDYAIELEKQLNFLENSASLIDAGKSDEAVRLAVTLRVIFHQTAASTSLLTHLGESNPNMLATGTPMGPKTYGEGGLTMARATGTGTGVIAEVRAKLGDGPPTSRIIPFEQWWPETIYRRGDLITTRRSLVLAAANKDGGAHIDDLPANYEQLKVGLWALHTPQNPELRLSDQWAQTLRQIAYEVLNTRDILKLAGRSFLS